ncbi:unnamed protein product [Dovyalis caffra]|uniref:Uncharacterized protein n=1 Tax=Dovyalis caffra TaxID=77055 RepID=A0AAV1RIY2_9ROSI|nr:unnamed protein product [Dovyalis caffra]
MVELVCSLFRRKKGAGVVVVVELGLSLLSSGLLVLITGFQLDCGVVTSSNVELYDTVDSRYEYELPRENVNDPDMSSRGLANEGIACEEITMIRFKERTEDSKGDSFIPTAATETLGTLKATLQL